MQNEGKTIMLMSGCVKPTRDSPSEAVIEDPTKKSSSYKNNPYCVLWGESCASGNSPRFLFESVIEEPFSFSLLRLHLPPFVTEKLGFRIYLKDKKWCLTSQHRTLAKSILIRSIGMRVEAYNSKKKKKKKFFQRTAIQLST